MNDQNELTVARLLRAAGRRPAVDPGRLARVREAVHAEWEREVDKRRTRTAIWAIASIAVAAIIAAVLLFIRAGTSDVHFVPRAMQATTTPATFPWNGATLRLEPGTLLWIEHDAARLERGTVHYSSGTRADQITIRTPYGDVRDIGTAFEVKLAGNGVHVRVDEGLVEMRGTTISAGMGLFATSTNVEQLVTLEGQTLREVVEHVARAKGLNVRWVKAPSDAKLHGDVPLPLDDALDAATAAAGVSYRVEGSELVVAP